jgi:CBS domain-containing protein
MKIKEIMTSGVKSCSIDTNLATAAKIMWEEDCGAVPVTDGRGNVVGMITDRDICIAAATRPRAEGDIQIREVLSRPLQACSPTDEVQAALETMKTQQLRRLPVVDGSGRLEGIVSLHDIAMQAKGRQAGVSAADVLDTYIAITTQPHPRTAAFA